MRFPMQWLWPGLVATGGICAAAGLHPEAGVGDWIWAGTMRDRQECRFVREFEIPARARVESAIVRITADNSYRLFLDGQPIGQGGDWRVLIAYDITRLLPPGHHVLAVSAVNDFDIAGLLAGLRIRLGDGTTLEIPSDSSWEIAPEGVEPWQTPPPRHGPWPPARVVKSVDPDWHPQVYQAPASLPVPVSLWQRRWFQVALILGGVTGLIAGAILSAMLLLKTQAERVVRRERARIAGDLHDNLGGGLTHLVLLGETSRRAAAGEAAEKLERLGEQARELMRGMNETVWLINSQRDTVRDLASFLARQADAFFRDTAILCRLEVDADLPPAPCDLGVRRNLLLAVKEVMNNILRHSQAAHAELRIEWRREVLRIVIRDDGCGFDPAAEHAGDGLRNLRLRAQEAGGRFTVRSRRGEGSEFEFVVPVAARTRLGLLRRLRPRG